MLTRWAIAAASVFVLLGPGAPTSWRVVDAVATDEGLCDANRKPANLSIALKDINNENVRLADYKGKVIAINFWATSCAPCRFEIPAFVDLQARYGAQGLQVIGISVGDTRDLLEPYVARFRMNYPVLQGLDREDVKGAFGPIFAIPETVIVSRAGNVCRKHRGVVPAHVVEREIKSLL